MGALLGQHVHQRESRLGGLGGQYFGQQPVVQHFQLPHNTVAAGKTQRLSLLPVQHFIDEASGKVGIKHEAIANLKMPPMNMVFLLANPAQLQGLKVGDAVRFHAENPAGKLTVTAIQKL